jgi:hypothetical protein
MVSRVPLVLIAGAMQQLPVADRLDYAILGNVPAAIAAFEPLVPVADRVPYYTGPTTAALAVQTPYARTFLDDADAPTARGTLGLGTAAVQNIGTSGANVPLLNGASLSFSPGPFVFQSPATDLGGLAIYSGSSTGPITNRILAVYRDSPLNDANRVFEIVRTTSGGVLAYGSVVWTAATLPVSAYGLTLIDDVDAPAARGTLGLGTAAVVNTGTGGATVPLLNTSPSWTGTSFVHIRQDTGAGALVIGNLNKAVGGDIYQIIFRSLDSNDNLADYAMERGVIVDPTDGAESGGLEWRTAVAGTMARRMHLRQGLYADGVSGNDKGLGTANFTALYEAGIAISAKYYGGTVSAYGSTLIDDVDAVEARGTLGLGTAAVQNIGTSGANVPLLNTGNIWSASQVIDAPGPLTLTWTDDGSIAVALVFDRISSSPAAADRLGTFQMKGRNSAAASVIYGSFTGNISSPTAGAETASFNFNTLIAGTSVEALRIGDGVSVQGVVGGQKGIGTANFITYYENNVLLSSKYFAAAGVSAYGATLIDDVDAPAARGTLGLGTVAVQNIGTSGANVPLLSTANTWGDTQTIERTGGGIAQLFLGNQTSTVGQSVSQIVGQGWDAASALTQYTMIRSIVGDSTAGAASGILALRTRQSGNMNDVLRLGFGAWTSSATGGDKGLNTLNANVLYEAGVAISTKYYGGIVSSYGATLIDDPDATTARGTLGLGTAATANTGTSGATVPFLSATNIWSGDQEIRKGGASTGSMTIGGQMQSNGAIVGQFVFQGWDSAGNPTQYSMVRGAIVDNTDGGEDGRVVLRGMIDGNGTDICHFTRGVHTPSQTDQGVNTINGGTLYEANVSLITKYATLNGANVLGGANTFNGVVTVGRLVTATLVIADDAVGTFTLGGTGLAIIALAGQGSLTALATPRGMWWARATSSPALHEFSKVPDANTVTTTGILTGTTGTDGNFTISAHTDNTIYLENRSGASRTVRVLVMATT